MAFSHRMAALAAVVAIPLGIAATSYALTDSPEPPKSPPKLELDSGSPSPSGSGSGTSKPKPTPSDEVVSRPPVSDGPSGDDDDGGGADDADDDRSERGGDGDDG
ncbi:small secreted hydrophilic protein [Streptomyces cavernicola]|uniref:Small secreted hydrophilic protein n=1 Tax=Streptomyces cavernicola TaxID=3043613 RepID=A0ABT6S4Q6_9ACTN|nr:small secreted hydrophilic protein [Streptomyces sp. B-S-A6]MDI3403077.1 small secreted hydrophilic protein [Streptomyces sp. B-S-A6]